MMNNYRSIEEVIRKRESNPVHAAALARARLRLKKIIDCTPIEKKEAYYIFFVTTILVSAILFLLFGIF